MRLLLDAHVSGRRIARALRDDGHDVVAINEDEQLAALADPAVLALAARDERVLVTFNHRDFVPLVRDWASAGHDHGGCVIVYGIDHSEFGLIVRRIRELLATRPDQASWRGLTLPLTRGG